MSSEIPMLIAQSEECNIPESRYAILHLILVEQHAGDCADVGVRSACSLERLSFETYYPIVAINPILVTKKFPPHVGATDTAGQQITGFRSTTGVPSIASIGPILMRPFSIALIVT